MRVRGSARLRELLLSPLERGRVPRGARRHRVRRGGAGRAHLVRVRLRLRLKFRVRARVRVPVTVRLRDWDRVRVRVRDRVRVSAHRAAGVRGVTVYDPAASA